MTMKKYWVYRNTRTDSGLRAFVMVQDEIIEATSLDIAEAYAQQRLGADVFCVPIEGGAISYLQ